MTPNLSLDRLEDMLKATEGATPGPWGFEQTSAGMADMRVYADRGLEHRHGYTIALVAPQKDNEDAAHLANCDPQTIASILTELTAFRKAGEWQTIDTAPHACHMLVGYFDHDLGDWVVSVEMQPFAENEHWSHWRMIDT